MANGFLGNISADLILNNKMGSAIASASASMKGMETQMKNIGTSLAASLDGPMAKLKAMPAETKYLGAALALGVTAPLLAFGSAATKTFSSFDDSMRQVQAVTGATGPQFQALTNLAREMGETTSFKASEAAEAMTYLGMAGFKTDDIISALPATLALARAGVLDLGSAADIMSNVMTIFGMSADEAGHAADVLAKVAHSTNTNVQQLGEAMTYAGPVAHTFGLSMEMTAAAMGLLGNAGIQASMAGTTLRGILQELVAPTKASMDVFTKYGLTLEDLNPKVHSLDVIFKTLKESGMSDAEMFTVFGQRAGPGLQALLSQGIDTLGNYSVELQNVDGYAEQAAKTMDEGFGGALRMMNSALESFSISIGSRLAVMMGPLVAWVTKAAQVFADLNPRIQDAIIVIGLLLAALGPVILALAALPTIVAGVTGGLALLSGAWAVIVSVLSGGIVPAIALVVAALYILEEKTGLISGAWQFAKDAFVIFADVISQAIVQLKQIVVENTEWIREAVSNLIPTEAIETVTEWYDTIKSAFGDAATTVNDRANVIREENKKTAESFDQNGVAATESGKVVEAAAGTAGNAVTNYANLAVEGYGNADAAAGTAGDAVTDYANLAVAGYGNAGDAASQMGADTDTATGQMSQGLILVTNSARPMVLAIQSGVDPVTDLKATIAGATTTNHAYAASFVDVSNMANAAASAAISASSRIGSAIKTSIGQVGELESLAGKWNTTAKLGTTSSGGKGTGEGNVKVVDKTGRYTTPVTKSGSSGTGESGVKVISTTNKNTVNNNGDKLSASKAKAAGV